MVSQNTQYSLYMTKFKMPEVKMLPLRKKSTMGIEGNAVVQLTSQCSLSQGLPSLA